MSRQLFHRPDSAVEVRHRDGIPEQFLWRGRLYRVREVLERWTECGPWWDAATRRADTDTSFGEVGPGISFAKMRAESGPAARADTRAETRAGSGPAARAETRAGGSAYPRAEARTDTLVLEPIAPSPKWAQRAWGEPAPDLGAAAGPATFDDAEREFFRVEAAAGSHFAPGVYDLCLDPAAGQWSLATVLD